MDHESLMFLGVLSSDEEGQWLESTAIARLLPADSLFFSAVVGVGRGEGDARSCSLNGGEGADF